MTMDFIDHHDDPLAPLDGEDGPRRTPSPRPCAADAGAVARRARPLAADLPTGVMLPNTADVATLAARPARLALVVLQFPKWTDGRAYSQARLLRGRHRFAGDLRATGDVLVDMLPLLQRTGFSSAQLRADQNRRQRPPRAALLQRPLPGRPGQGRPLFHRQAA
jgi:uncharacterized protein (DUF934 family)